MSISTVLVQRFRPCWLSLFFILGAVYLDAQAVSQISGSVTDQSGAAVPGVQVTVTQTDTSVTRTAVTNENGSYMLSNLPIGPYRIEAMKMGFRTYVQTGVVLQVDSAPTIPIALAVGEISTQVQVEANATQVESRAMGVANVIDNQRVLDLPLNGRQPTDLIALSGAAVQTGTSPQWGMATGAQISIAGGLTYGVGYALDGAALSNFYDATGFPLPFPDALLEFKVETSSLSAQNGTHSGGSVNGVTKSGTNAFHGDLFEFLRNGDLNARNFFSPTRDSLKRNQFGGVIGGPIKKDKLFFFAGYQDTLLRTDSQSNLAFVPTPAMLTGNFSACPSDHGLVIPNFKLSPAAAFVASKLPQSSDPCGAIRYSIPQVDPNTGLTQPTTSGQIVGRLDYQLNATHSIFGRYMATWDRAPVPYEQTKNLLDSNNNGLNDLAQSAAIGETWLINPTTVNTFRVAMNREAVNHPGPSFFTPAQAGVNAYASVPEMWVIAPGAFTIGQGTGALLDLYNTQVHINDDVNLARGSHQFAFGVNVAQSLVDGLARVFSQGIYVFAGAQGPLPAFLQGQVASFQQETPNGLIEYQRYFGLYMQDTWKVSPRLTLNYGVRWEPFFPAQIKTGQVYNFSLTGYQQGLESKIYPNAPAGFTYPGDAGFNGNASNTTAWKDFQPRIGFGWDPFGDGRTSIRGGAGIAYDFTNLQLHHNDDVAAPFGGRVAFGGVSLDNPWANFPGGDPFPYVSSPGHGTFPAYAAYQPIPQNLGTPQVQTWNLAVQRQINKQWFASVSYVGNHAIHVLNQIELNPAVLVPGLPILASGAACSVVPVTANCPSNVNARRVLDLQNPVKAQAIGNITAYDSSATQDYNGLLLNTTWKAGRNLNINANYTWSHCIGDINVGNGVPNPGAATPNNYLGGNRLFDRGNCVQDRRQLANITAVTQTPRFGNSAMGRVARDWRLSVIYQYRSGTPINLNTGSDNQLTGGNGNGAFEKPNQVLSNPFGSGLQYLNPAAFATPALGTGGNTGVYGLAGPGFWEIDMALVREIPIRENQRLEIRGEAFNLTNSMRPLVAGFGLASTGFYTLNSGTFGLIQNAYDPRIIQLALKFVF